MLSHVATNLNFHILGNTQLVTSGLIMLMALAAVLATVY